MTGPTAEELLTRFGEAFAAQRRAVGALEGSARRARADGHAGQYALDVAADAAVLDVLHRGDVAVLSEESGRSGPADAPVVVVVDPVDGSTNCSRGIPYWGISLCALDADGPWCALVANGATGEVTTAVRGEGAQRDGVRIHASPTTRIAESVVALETIPPRPLGWKQGRILGSAALSLCDVAAGRIDAWASVHHAASPWDYLGGVLVAREAGAEVVDVDGRDLETYEPATTRVLLAAGTPALLDELRAALAP